MKHMKRLIAAAIIAVCIGPAAARAVDVG